MKPERERESSVDKLGFLPFPLNNAFYTLALTYNLHIQCYFVQP